MRRLSNDDGTPPKPGTSRCQQNGAKLPNLKNFKDAVTMLIFSTLVSSSTAVTISCDNGYYVSSGVCIPCPVGSYCTGGAKNVCSSGQYAPAASERCYACPSGFSCSLTDGFPTACQPETGAYSTGSATSCATTSGAGNYVSIPTYAPSLSIYNAVSVATKTTCTAAILTINVCPQCRAGYYCSGGATTSCTSTTGSTNIFGNTATSCTTNPAGSFSNYVTGAISCPQVTYSSGAASSCTLPSQNYYVSSLTGGNSGQTVCSGNTQDAYGVGVCSSAVARSWIDTTKTAPIQMIAIPYGYYAVSGVQTAIPAGYYATSVTAAPTVKCESMKYSNATWGGYCVQIPIGYRFGTPTAGTLSTCGGSNFNKLTSSCTSCTNAKCDLFSGITVPCQVGYYFPNSAVSSCSICPAGSYCTPQSAGSSTQSQLASAAYPTINQQAPDNAVACAAGYGCTSTTMVANAIYYYSTTALATAVIQQYNIARDLYSDNAGGNCPSSSYQDTVTGLKCTPTSLHQQLVNDPVTGLPSGQQSFITWKQLAWIGETPVTFTQNSNFTFASDEMAVYSGVHCPTGWNATLNPPSNDYICVSQPTSYPTGQQFLNGVAQSCPTGQVVYSGLGSSAIHSRYTGLGGNTVPTSGGQCQDCPPNLICGGTSYGWCVGKTSSITSTTIKWYDANQLSYTGSGNSYLPNNLQLHMDDRRVSQSQNQNCMDCNAIDFASGICTFASDYYPDHVYTGTTSIKTEILKCPFQSATRTQSRYLDSVGWTRLDSRSTTYTYNPPGSSSYTYTTYAFFDDVEPNEYPYSFCQKNTTFFTGNRITAHSQFFDTTEQAYTECTLYEFYSPNFPMCQPNHGGFISDVTHVTPTETAIPTGYLTNLIQNDDYTGQQLSQCPEFTQALMSEGAASIFYGCQIKNLGVCKDSTSDYCNNGQDYDCPNGFTLKSGLTSSTKTNTINDCYSCGAGSVCSTSATSTTCPTGYNCQAMTSDVYSKPGQPGELIITNAATGNDISTCAAGYCSGASASSQNFNTCPQGYYNIYSGNSYYNQFTKASCSPLPAGSYATLTNSFVTTQSFSYGTCPAGKMCPSGSSTATINTPAGYYSASTGISSINGLTECPAGSFCAPGSTTSTTLCTAGYYCELGLEFAFDTPCNFGKTSTAGATSSAQCTACTNGNFCKQGATAPLTDGSYCGNSNFLCIGGNLERTTCSSGQYTSDGATCSACSAGSFCTPGITPQSCSAGYTSSAGAASCSLSTPGTITTGGTSSTSTSAGQWTIAGQTTAFTCPPGYSCTGGVITGCQNGFVCAEGASAPVAAAAGTVGDQVNLFYQQPCPPGSTCAGGAVARATVAAGSYSLQGNAGTTPLYCASGYSCAAGSIGPYQSACASGTYYTTGSATSTCATCATGSYCFQGMQTACEPGMYCNVATSPSFHQQCPVGTYSTTGDTSSTCTPCGAGTACLQPGMSSASTYNCAEGYFCVVGATSTTPVAIPGTDDAKQCNPYKYQYANSALPTYLIITGTTQCNQGICPKGYYCPEATGMPLVCYTGTFNLNYGEVSGAGCIACTPGYYCPDTLTKTVCAAGTICPTNSSTNANQPAIGYYSLSQYPDQIPCPAGYFQATVGQSSCTICTAGSQCSVTALSAVQTCARGSDCSQPGVIVPQLCQYGYYLDPSNAVNPGCVACPVDQYCWNDGIIQSDITANSLTTNNADGIIFAGKCPSGYKCVSGAIIPGMNFLYSQNPNAYMCRQGNYCDNTLTTVENPCPTGTYMPRTGAKTVSECLACPPGYQCANTGTITPTSCPTGIYCAQGTSTSILQCQPGNYCPTLADQEFACAYGSYSTAAGSTVCLQAPAGSFVNAIQQSSTTSCTAGYYCLIGQATPLACPMGTTSVAGGSATTSCTNVPLGSYQASPSTKGTIIDGYYSLQTGEYNPIPTRNGAICPPGSYCPAGILTTCVAGTICQNEGTYQNVVAGVDECNAGYYCFAGCTRQRPVDTSGATLSMYHGTICPAQRYCPISSTTYTSCPAGTYSNAIGLQASTECTQCKNGFYCNTEALSKEIMLTQLCPQGYFCGVSTTTSTQNICQIGYYCAQTPVAPAVATTGALEMVPCAPGYYSDSTGLSVCKSCTVNNFCKFYYSLPSGATSQLTTCPIGYYCPSTLLSAPIPCSPGQYQDTTGASTCKTGAAGYYYPLQQITSQTTFACPNQFYCPAGSQNPILCVNGQWCDSSNPSTQSVSTPTPCPAGYYCIAGVRYLCFSGYVCVSGATTPAPTDGTTGYACPKGMYCPDGATQVNCGVGYYNPTFGSSFQTDCLICPSGTTCPLAANAIYTQVSCPGGYICNSTGNFPCVIGTYCPQGTQVMQNCTKGTFQNTIGQQICNQCEEGYYCPNMGMSTETKCPDGFYCPSGTGNPEIFRCPIGTFHDTSLTATTPYGLKSSSECSECPETYYCPTVALTLNTASPPSPFPFPSCMDGFLCPVGSATATGSAQCGKDSYCQAGISYTCPDGYYSTVTGLTSSSECIACAPGKYCPSHSVSIQNCYAGYYCTGAIYLPYSSSDATNPSRMTICPIGSYCPSGSAQPLLCQPGTYNGLTGQTTCTTCDAGSYCPTSGMTAPTACSTLTWFPYCPVGSVQPIKCSIGYYIDDTTTQCLACPAGKYCWPNSANNGIQGACDQSLGYMCRSASYTPQPLVANLEFIQPNSNLFWNYNGPVLGGYYTTDAMTPTPCPIGTFQPSIMSAACIDCYEGSYCPNQGMSSLQGYKCDAGYYCNRGNWEEAPNNDVYVGVAGQSLTTGYVVGTTIIGGPCPLEYECSYSLYHKMQCQDGFISQSTGLAMCTSCPDGYYCDNVVNPVAPIECITQSVCPAGSPRQPICPPGTFYNEGGYFCQKCTAGNYCRAGIIADQCAAGYVSAIDDFTTQPNPAGTECPAAFYCPKGSTVALNCPFTTQSTVVQAKQIKDCVSCQPGYLCPYGQRNATVCPAGNYCPPKGDSIEYPLGQYPCPVGTWTPWTLQVYQSDCQLCSSGYYCNKTGIANLTGLDCPEGFYCPVGTIQPYPCPAGTYSTVIGAIDDSSCVGCPIGTYCEEGSSTPTECEDGFSCPYMSATMITCSGGFYCNSDAKYEEVECPTNSYCPRGSAYPQQCDNKHTCPAGTEAQIFCQNGYYVDTRPSSYGGQNQCVKCPAGTYSIADSIGCLPCPAGYLCYGGTNSNAPSSVQYNRGEPCQQGNYCPVGSSFPIQCPPGTYNQNLAMGDSSQCTLCAAGTSNSEYGAQGCQTCGQFANSNEGATVCKCNGQNRVYSPVDNSCRCMTGFDFYSSDGVSQGTSSDNSDCIPLVFNRCVSPQVRSPTGSCVNPNDCTAECSFNGTNGTGTRDSVTGVCACNNTPRVDNVCNQACRASAPKVTFTSATTVSITTGNKTQTVDLSQVADVYGSPNVSGSVKTVSMTPNGIAGSYTPPPIIQTAANLTALASQNQTNTTTVKNSTTIVKANSTMIKTNSTALKTNSTTNLKRELSNPNYDEEEINLVQSSIRQLQSQSAQTTTTGNMIPNPIYCIKQGDTFLFTISDPTHYPVYMVNSVMNTNKLFDFGAFLDLGTSMIAKQKQGSTTPSMFGFTFTDSGNYVFQDSTSASLLLIISVKGAGEKCADPDRYLQTISGDTLAHLGVSQRSDIILQPNYPLIISMTFLLIFGTGFTMWMVSYCMRKGWNIKELRSDNYRETHLAINIHHENERVFLDNNDFINHKSDLIDHDEDQLDGCNLDIQQDLIDAGTKYLHKYEKRKQKHKKLNFQKKIQIQDLLHEVESLVNVLNSDSTAAQMHWLDLDALQDGAQMDDKKIKLQIEKQMNAINKQEEAMNENYKQKKEELLNNANERDRLLHQQAHEKMKSQQHENTKKHSQVNSDQVIDVKAAAEFAIYDNGDVKTKNNQLVRKIELNKLLSDEEKEKLLQQHENCLHNIDSLLEVETKKQEHELDRALKERLDRRHRLKEKQHAKDIRNDCKEAEHEVNELYEEKKKSEIARLSKEHEMQVKDIISNTDLVLQRQQIQALEELTQQKKQQIMFDLEQQHGVEVETRKLAITKKYLNGSADEQDLQNQLKKILGENNNNVNALFNQADNERAAQEQRLQDKIAKRKEKAEQDLQKEADKVIYQIQNDDVIAAHEREVVATEAHLRLKAKSMLQDGIDGLLPTGCLGLDKQGLPITDMKVLQAADVARKETEERKADVREAQFRLLQQIDTTIQSKSLLSELESQDASLALHYKQQEDIQAAQLEARKAQLRGRRIAKVQEEKNENLLRANIEAEEEKLTESREITEAFVRKLFKNIPKNETPQQKDKRLEIFNEYFSDEFLTQLSNLLIKQFTEKDAYLKLCLHKYMDEQLEESSAIKAHFKIDYDALQTLKIVMSDAVYNELLRNLRLSEENLLRSTDLQIQKCHAEEEARIRKELDKKHMQEQIELRQNISQRQSTMRLQLIGESQLGEQEQEFDRKALERFQQLKITEQDRRIRAIELQKKTLTNQVESELKAQYTDYDEMIRRKKASQKESEEQEMSLRKRISERRDKLKKNTAQDGLSKEEQEAMLKNYLEQLSQLDSAYAAEQRRQQLIMKTKQENRKKRLVKVQQLKQELEKQTDVASNSKLTTSFANVVRRQMIGIDNSAHEDDNSELLQRLREWNIHKRDYEVEKFAQKASQAGAVELDENQIKIMIIKLQQIEKLLKEFGKQKKLKLKGAVSKKQRRRSSVQSTLQNFVNEHQQSFKGVIGAIQENVDSEDSEEGLLKVFPDSNKTNTQPNNPVSARNSTGFGMRATPNQSQYQPLGQKTALVKK